MTLDDRIYRLQRSYLPADLSDLLRRADRYFLYDLDNDAETCVLEIEIKCKERGILLHEE